MKIIMNILGVFIYFLIRYENRKNKMNFNVRFWIKDNWVEIALIGAFDVSLMILLISNDVSFEMAEFLPAFLQDAGDLTTAWLIGMVLSSACYNAIKKVKKG